MKPGAGYAVEKVTGTAGFYLSADCYNNRVDVLFRDKLDDEVVGHAGRDKRCAA